MLPKTFGLGVLCQKSLSKGRQTQEHWLHDVPRIQSLSIEVHLRTANFTKRKESPIPLKIAVEQKDPRCMKQHGDHG